MVNGGRCNAWFLQSLSHVRSSLCDQTAFNKICLNNFVQLYLTTFVLFVLIAYISVIDKCCELLTVMLFCKKLRYWSKVRWGHIRLHELTRVKKKKIMLSVNLPKKKKEIKNIWKSLLRCVTWITWISL